MRQARIEMGKKKSKKANRNKKKGNNILILSLGMVAGTLLIIAGCLLICWKKPISQYENVEEFVENEENSSIIMPVEEPNLDNKKDIESELLDEEKIDEKKESSSQASEGQQEDKTSKRTLSIVGDSISTFKGTMPDGYYDFFPDNGLIKSVEETWWKPVVDNCDLELYTNASSSGATCAGDSTSADNPQVGCDELRMKALYGANGESPDIIIVYMGTNDLLESIPIGSNDGTKAVEEGAIENFSDAYTLMLDKLQRNYPQAEIYCCTITPLGTWGENDSMVTFVNGAGEGLTSREYSQTIQQIANNKGCKVIDLYNCGINLDNILEMTSDGVHPSVAGMHCIGQMVEKALCQ